MITRINESKTLKNIHLLVENVTQTKSGTTINADVSAKIQ